MIVLGALGVAQRVPGGVVDVRKLVLKSKGESRPALYERLSDGRGLSDALGLGEPQEGARSGGGDQREARVNQTGIRDTQAEAR
jgi:hypothetical protein